MSKTGKIIMWIVIAVIVVGGGIWWWMASQSSTAMQNSGAGMNGISTSSVAAVAASGTVPAASYPQGDSDQSINQDMASLNAQINGLSSDNASVTQSMNDQPVQQAE